MKNILPLFLASLTFLSTAYSAEITVNTAETATRILPAIGGDGILEITSTGSIIVTGANAVQTTNPGWTINNSGDLSGTVGLPSNGIELDDGGIINNLSGGTITGTDIAINIGILTMNQDSIVTNSGTITAGTNAVDFNGNAGFATVFTLNLIGPGSNLVGNAAGSTFNVADVNILNVKGTGTEDAIFTDFQELQVNTAGTDYTLTSGSTFVDAVNVSAGKLTLDANTAASGSGFNVSGTGELVLNDTNHTGDLTLSGTGVVTLDSAITGPTIINGDSTLLLTNSTTVNGTLTANGGLVSSTGTGAILAGATVINSGATIKPGSLPSEALSSIGTPFTLNSGGTMDIVFNDTASSKINVPSTTATINGNIRLTPVGALPPSGTTYAAVVATTLVESATLITPPLISATKSVVADELLYTITYLPLAANPATPLTSPAKAPADSIDSLGISNLSGTLLSAVTAIYSNYSPSLSQEAFNALAGPIYTSMYPVMLHESQAFTQPLFKRMEHIRGYYKYFHDGIPLLAQTEKKPKKAKAIVKKTRLLSPHKSFSRNWVQPVGGFMSSESADNYPGFDVYSGGLQFGRDAFSSDNLLVGIMGGFSYSKIDWKCNMGKADAYGFRAGGYLDWSKENWFFDITSVLGYKHWDVDRNIEFSGFSAKASQDFWTFDASLSSRIGCGFNISCTTLTPFASIDFLSLYNPDIEESGAGTAGLNTSSSNTESLKLGVGLRLTSMLDFNRGYPIGIDIYGQWKHEILNNQMRLNAQFQNPGIAYFDLNGREMNRHSWQVGGRITPIFNNCHSMFLSYFLEINDKSQAHNIGAGYQFAF